MNGYLFKESKSATIKLLPPTKMKSSGAASASAALLHGNDWSDTKNIWKTAPLVLLMVYGVTAVVTVLLGNILF